MDEPAITPAQQEQYDAEQQRIDKRRELLRLDPQSKTPWALALSGGGIRSATFCLGILQSLARARAPGASSDKENPRNRLIARFDYLSTVSGGGYLGSFFGSLFLPGRLRASSKAPVASSPEVQAAKDAYKVLDYEPPGRIHTSVDYREAPPGEAPLAWLRENGRYLTPGSSGDIFYVLALSLRNLLALHVVIGMPLLFSLAFAVLVQVGISSSVFCSPVAALLPMGLVQVLCGSLWWAPGLVAVAVVVPLMAAFWMVYFSTDQDERVKLFNWSTVLSAFAGGMFIALAFAPWSMDDSLRGLLLGLGAVSWLAIVYCVVITHGLRHERDKDNAMARHDCVRSYRVLVTRHLGQALIAVLAVSFFALIPWVTEWVYSSEQRGSWISSTAALPVLIAVVRGLSALSDDKAMPGWLSRLPLSVIAGVAGIVIFILVAVLWGLLVQFVRYAGPDNGELVRLGALVTVATILTFVTGRFIGFLNQSSLQSFYTSRLARAYLGASNGQRFDAATRELRKQRMSVAEALPRDDVPIETYYGTTTCAPLHLINVTMNLTVDPAEQLVQRDRKGKPLCLAPSGLPGQDSVSYILDGDPRKRTLEQRNIGSEIYQRLGLAHWVATSGAAFTTGLGRATSLGTSLAFGLTNVRLGSWWPANFLEEDDHTGRSRAWRDKGLKTILPTQTYLFYEFTAHFHGLRRDFQYLSDGGHFENTACYELVREGRKIDLIVMCDCGADPTYQFDDLANLIRLARIDQALEISEDPGIFEVEELAPYFGRIQDFRLDSEQRKQADYRRCAVLLNVHNKQQQLTSRILLIKPNLIAGLPVDLLNYANEHPTFPNESTANQFFDEAQFEGYRQLGLQIGRRLFGDGKEESKVADALWKYLEH